MNKKIASAAVWVTIISGFSKFIGLIRESCLAAYFGAGSDSDAFKIAFSIPDILFYIVSMAIVQTFIPVYNDYIKLGDEKKTERFLNNICTILGSVALVVICFGIVCSQIIVRLIAPGFDEITMNKAVVMTRIIMPSAFFFMFSFLAMSYLNANNRFIAPALMWYPNNLILVGTIVFFHQYGIIALAFGSAIAIFGMLAIQLPSCYKQGFRYKFVFNLKDEGVRSICRLLGPIIISGAINQIYVIVNRMMASTLEKGSISAIDYASRVSALINNIFIISVATVIFPYLAKYKDAKQQFSLSLAKALRIASIITLPLSAMFIVLGVPTVKLLFERGVFGAQETQMTAVALSGLSIGTIGVAYREILNRAFYALKDTWTPMINGVVAIGMNVLLNLVLGHYFGIGGLALGCSIAFLISGGMFLVSLRRKIGNIHGRWIADGFLKSATGTLIMAASVYFLQLEIVPRINTSGEVLETTATICLMYVFAGIIYFLALYMLRTDEAYMAFEKIFKNYRHKSTDRLEVIQKYEGKEIDGKE